MFYEREAQDGPRVRATNVLVIRERASSRRIIEDDTLLCSRGVLNYGLRQFSAGDWRVTQSDRDGAAAGSCFRLDPQLGTSRQNEQSTFRAGVLDGGAEQRVNEVFQDDFAGHRL